MYLSPGQPQRNSASMSKIILDKMGKQQARSTSMASNPILDHVFCNIGGIADC